MTQRASAQPLQLRICIDVDDLERAVRFYTQALGLQIGRRFGTAGAELLGAIAPIDLLAKPAETRPSPSASGTRSYARHWTPVHLDFVVTDLDSALAMVRDAGATQETPIQIQPWGRMVTLADPFGHGLCLIQTSERGYDAIATS